MKYLCLAYGDEKDWNALAKSEQDRLLAQDDVLRQRGDLVAALEQAVTTVTAWDGTPNATDHAFATPPKPLAGFGIIEANTLDAAIALVAQTPCARAKGAVELRPIMAMNNPIDIVGSKATGKMQTPESTALRLRKQLDCLPTLLAGITDDALEARPVPGKWSARENLAHLARYQDVFLSRIRRIQTETNPTLPRYRAEDDPEWPSWINRGRTEILEILRTQRDVLVHQIEKMGGDELARTAVHPRFGKMTLVQWLEFFLLHEAHHLLAVLQRSRERLEAGD